MKRVLLGVLLAACTKPNPNYCESNPNKDCRIDASTRCTSNENCSDSPETPVCELASGTCVRCTADEPTACTGTSPVCGDKFECRACKSHSECESRACLPSGACGRSSEVAYVDAQGSANNTCSFSQPCSSVALALMTGRPVIKIQGTLYERVTLNDRKVTILAEPGAALVPTTIGPVIRISGASEIGIYDLTIREGLGNTDYNNGFGIFVDTASSPPQPHVVLERVTIRDCYSGGIYTAPYTTLRMSRSIVVGNYFGGARINGNFDITNSIFVLNGTPSSSIGGLMISPGHPADMNFAFNTVADNMAPLGFGGVHCTHPIPLKNSIIFNNQSSTECAPDYSLLDPGAGPMAHNRFGNPLFKTTIYAPTLPADFYRISDISPAIDGADPESTISIDIDGDTRPQGNAPDIGADEYQP